MNAISYLISQGRRTQVVTVPVWRVLLAYYRMLPFGTVTPFLGILTYLVFSGRGVHRCWTAVRLTANVKEAFRQNPSFYNVGSFATVLSNNIACKQANGQQRGWKMFSSSLARRPVILPYQPTPFILNEVKNKVLPASGGEVLNCEAIKVPRQRRGFLC